MSCDQGVALRSRQFRTNSVDTGPQFVRRYYIRWKLLMGVSVTEDLSKKTWQWLQKHRVPKSEWPERALRSYKRMSSMNRPLTPRITAQTMPGAVKGMRI